MQKVRLSVSLLVLVLYAGSCSGASIDVLKNQKMFEKTECGQDSEGHIVCVKIQSSSDIPDEEVRHLMPPLYKAVQSPMMMGSSFSKPSLPLMGMDPFFELFHPPMEMKPSSSKPLPPLMEMDPIFKLLLPPSGVEPRPTSPPSPPQSDLKALSMRSHNPSPPSPPLIFTAFIDESDESLEPSTRDFSPLPQFMHDFPHESLDLPLGILRHLGELLSNPGADELIHLPDSTPLVVTLKVDIKDDNPMEDIDSLLHSMPFATEPLKMLSLLDSEPSKSPTVLLTPQAPVKITSPSTRQLEKTPKDNAKRDPFEDQFNEIRASYDSFLREAMGKTGDPMLPTTRASEKDAPNNKQPKH